jgi:hypothetical protein
MDQASHSGMHLLLQSNPGRQKNQFIMSQINVSKTREKGKHITTGKSQEIGTVRKTRTHHVLVPFARKAPLMMISCTYSNM